MSVLRGIAVMLTVLGITLSHPTASGASAPTPSPADVTLHSSDLPDDFFEGPSRSVSNDEAANTYGVSTDFLRKLGRIDGFRSEHYRDTGRGIYLLNDMVEQYGDPRGANWAYRQGVAGDARFPSYPGFKMLRNPAAGTALVTFRNRWSVYPTTVDVLDTHKGNYYFWIEMNFVTGTASPGLMTREILYYAALIKSRIPPTTARPMPPVQQPPTALPSPLPTPPPLQSPLKRATCTYAGNTRATGLGVDDSASGVHACVETMDNVGSVNSSGYLNTSKDKPARGDIFLFAWIGEQNDTHQAPYQSTIQNFRAQGADGRQFGPRHGAPFGTSDPPLANRTLKAGDPPNEGYIEFEVPEHDGPYAVLWNEGSAIPWTSLASLAVFPSH